MDELTNLRKIIDVLDDEILGLIAERQVVVERIGRLKASHKIAVYDPKREEILKAYHQELSEKYSLSIDFVINLFEIIMEESRRMQQINMK
jgi:chorismate mutase